MSPKLDFPATARNREPIASVLGQFWNPDRPLRLLEVASGSGQHAVFFSERFPNWTFQPSDIDPLHLQSIAAYRQDLAGENLLPPIGLDVGATPWPFSESFDAILAINLIHISPWACTEALFAQSKQHLNAGGAVYLYGAFLREGRHTAPSNQSFDESLRLSDPSWGVRCLDKVTRTAQSQGFRLASVVEMPANNLSVLFTYDLTPR